MAGNSVRDRIVKDDEAADLLFQMVRSGTDVLISDWHYKTFCKMLEEIILENDHFKKYRGNNDNGTFGDFVASIVWNRDDRETTVIPDPSDQSIHVLVNTFTEEILRYLAMKILIENKSQGNKKEDTNDNMVMKLTPSDLIKEGWIGLMLFPLTYGDVCKAMGSNSALDYSSDDEDCARSSLLLQGKLSKKMWKLECYEWTLGTYDQLYNGEPSPIFWPRPRGQGQRKSPPKEGDQHSVDGVLRGTVEKFANSLGMINEAIKNTAQKSCVTIAETNSKESIPKCVEYMSSKGCDRAVAGSKYTTFEA